MAAAAEAAMAINSSHSLKTQDSFEGSLSRRLRLSQSHPSLCGDSDVVTVEPSPRLPAQTAYITLQSPVTVGNQPKLDTIQALHTHIHKTSSTQTPGNGPRKRRFSSRVLDHAPKSPPHHDRFIPVRKLDDGISSPFRIGKSPHELSPEEKLLRRRTTSEDPFRSQHSRRAIASQRDPEYIQHTRSPHLVPHLLNSPALSRHDDFVETGDTLRQVSAGAVWVVGGASIATGGRPLGIPNGVGGLSRSGTTAPMHIARFFDKTSSIEEYRMHESRLALALDIDLANRLLGFWALPSHDGPKSNPSSPRFEKFCPLTWKDHSWKRAEWTAGSIIAPKPVRQSLPTLPFRILDAPLLRNDFYCSVLAYCHTSGFLAVGLCNTVFLWSDTHGLEFPPLPEHPFKDYITSLSFSSPEGERSILAVGRQTGQVCLWSTYESEVRFEANHPHSVSCVAFKPVTSRRLSTRLPGIEVDVEELAVGDECGNVWYYSVEWPDYDLDEWNGTMILLAKIAAHKQQICGLCWSPDGTHLATGGNDNVCQLFNLDEMVHAHQVTTFEQSLSMAYQPGFSFESSNFLSRLSISARIGQCFSRFQRSFSGRRSTQRSSSLDSLPSGTVTANTGSILSGDGHTVFIPWNRQKRRLDHCAAVKAIAFAPWEPTLLATGGGSNDRSVRFYHTTSGSCLAMIDVHAQVTSLIWSKTRREIAVTLGFALPEHPFRIAVFAWPSCEQVAAIPWNVNISGIWDPEAENNIDCGRALFAISHPGSPSELPLAANRRQQMDDTDILAISEFGVAGTIGDAISHSTSPRTSTIHHGSIGSPTARSRDTECDSWSRTAEEGCIVVAGSDESIRFYQVWGNNSRNTVRASGLLGHSAVLESLAGIENPGALVMK